MQHLVLKTIRIKNLRCIKDETVAVGDYNCLVGPNGAGKSTVLYALNIFFRETQNVSTGTHKLSAEDFFGGNTGEPIEITLTFDVTSDVAKASLSHYVREDKLIIHAVAKFDVATNTAPVIQHGIRRAIPQFATYRERASSGGKLPELTEIYNGLRANFVDLKAAGNNPTRTTALDEFEAEHPELLEDVASPDQFYGFSGSDRLSPFIQWVYVPAVKDASDEQTGTKNSSIEKLIDRAVKGVTKFEEQIGTIRQEAETKYGEMLEEHAPALTELQDRLTTRIQGFAHPDIKLNLSWDGDSSSAIRISTPMANVRASEFSMDAHSISRAGHGVQRSYIFALLQELATSDAEDAPTLLLGVEEPELYQHPPQARHLAGVFQQLAEQKHQIIVTTHSPSFVSSESFENIRIVQRDTASKEAKVRQANYRTVLDRLKAAGGTKPGLPPGLKALVQAELAVGISEMFFCKTPVLVEGLEDQAYIIAHAMAHGYWDEMRKVGAAIIPVQGKGHLPRPLAIAQELSLRAFTIFDGDANQAGGKFEGEHKRDNEILFKLLGIVSAGTFPTNDIWGDCYTVWQNNIGDAVLSEFDEASLREAADEAAKTVGYVGDREKKPLYIGSLISQLAETGKRSARLDKLCESIITFGKG